MAILGANLVEIKLSLELQRYTPPWTRKYPHGGACDVPGPPRLVPGFVPFPGPGMDGPLF